MGFVEKMDMLDLILNVLKEHDKELDSIDLVVTSPPYWGHETVHFSVYEVAK